MADNRRKWGGGGEVGEVRLCLSLCLFDASMIYKGVAEMRMSKIGPARVFR